MSMLRFYGSADSAYYDIGKRLKEIYGVYYQRKFAGDRRHAVYEPMSMRSDLSSFYVIFKRESFHTFEHWFPSFIQKNPEMKGKGECINKDILEFAKNRGIDYIMIIRSPGEIYKISVMVWYKYAIKNGLVRCQKKLNDYIVPNSNGKRQEISEVTYCIPLKLLEPFIREEGY